MSADMRKWFYLISGVIAALIPVGIQVGILDTGQGDSTTTLLAGLAGPALVVSGIGEGTGG
jgi:hypothetical protein